MTAGREAAIAEPVHGLLLSLATALLGLPLIVACQARSVTRLDGTHIDATCLGAMRKEERTRATMPPPRIRVTSAHEFPTLEAQDVAADAATHLSYGLGWALHRHDEEWRHHAVSFDRPKSDILIMTNDPTVIAPSSAVNLTCFIDCRN